MYCIFSIIEGLLIGHIANTEITKFTIAQWRKFLNQTNNNDVKIITASFQCSILAVAAKKKFLVILEDTGDGITILNNYNCLLLTIDFMYIQYRKKKVVF